MKSPRASCVLLAATALLAVGTAAAEDVDPATLYDLSTEGSSAQVKTGEKGKFVVSIKARDGAYVSDEAPLKIQVKGQKVTPEKTTLKLSDSVTPVPAGSKQAQPRFEVPIKGETQGAGAVDAKVTFFICTEKLCARQQKDLTVPVEVH
jgi:hypothetical protein